MVVTFHPLSETTRRRLIAARLDPDALAALVRMAVAEDLAGGTDVTTVATVPAGQRSVGTFGARQPGTLAGLVVVAAVIDAVCGDDASDVEFLVNDGDTVVAGQQVARVEAPTSSLLVAERTSLNLLCHLSGVATLTARWVAALEGTRAKVRDTRKTTPGLRALEKYAVRCGGGVNHRMALSDAALVKDNHVLAAGGVAAAFAKVRALESSITVEIEVDSLDGLVEAIEAGADLVLLDNFTTGADGGCGAPRRRPRPPGAARGERRPDPRQRRRGRRDGRRLHRRRRADPQREGPRPRPRPRVRHRPSDVFSRPGSAPGRA